MSIFVPGSAETRALAKKAAAARWAKVRGPEPYAGTFIEFMDLAGLTGDSFAAWRVHWKAVDGLPLTEAEGLVFLRHTGRQQPPTAPVRELWDVSGRRSGKTRSASARAFYEGIRRDYRGLLAPGERAVIPMIAADRKQAGQAFGYIARGLARLPEFAPYVQRTLKESIELTTGITIEVHTASYRTTRGYTVVALVADELSFWLNLETGANPDTEILTALRPGMATVPGALLIGCSTPYAPRGELYRAHQKYFGQDDPRVLVWVADTASMNPTLDPAVIAEAFASDPVAAASEYGQDGRVVFRADVAAFLDPAAVAAVTVSGRYELPPSGAGHTAFVDPSGGGGDSYALAIGHREGERAVLDCVRERRGASPEVITAEYAELLKVYGVSTVTGDRYAGAWPPERFAAHGIEYRPSELTKSELYQALLPAVNSGRVELLDLLTLRAQLVGLERRVARGGRDSIDHVPGGHDDVANCVAGCLVLAAAGAGTDWELIMQHFDRAMAPRHGPECRVCHPATGGLAAARVVRTPGELPATSQRCPGCGAVFPAADRVATCPACQRRLDGGPQPTPHLPSLLGRPAPPPDVLGAARSCPHCGAPGGAVGTCAACGHVN